MRRALINAGLGSSSKETSQTCSSGEPMHVPAVKLAYHHASQCPNVADIAIAQMVDQVIVVLRFAQQTNVHGLCFVFLRRSTSCIQVCDDGFFNCLVGFCCPCVVFGRNAEIVDGMPCAVAAAIYVLLLHIFGANCLFTCKYRGKIRHKFGIPGSTGEDIILHCCCGPCARLQEARELKVHGMTQPNSLNSGAVQVPPPAQTMAV
eukprot:jgi/Mesvir1/28741/Mv19709-RA.1